MQPESADALASAVYVGEVYHRRFAPRTHVLRYRVCYLLLDLDELPQLACTSAWFGWNRRRWMSFDERDHGDGGRSYREWLVATLAAAGFGSGPWRFRVLCLPRVAGYVFNPISVVYCHTAGGVLGAMLYEVNNTFGERLAYIAPVRAGATTIRQRCDKALFVSPFLPPDGHYAFTLTPPGTTLDLCIDYYAGAARTLHAAFRGERLAWSRAALARAALAYPAATLKVIAGIHYEAIKLWLKGVPRVRHVAARHGVSIGTAE